jgi:hypothetical protein
MLADGVKHQEKEDEVRVLDIAELIAAELAEAGPGGNQ